MEHSRKFSKPPSSLNISRRAGDGSDSSASTPSEDYKTPSHDHAAIPGFEFGSREGEPEVPARMLQLMQDAGVYQPGASHNQLTAFSKERISVSAGALPKNTKMNRAVGVYNTETPRQFAGGHGFIVNGSNLKTGLLPESSSKLSDEGNIVPLLRSPVTSSRQMKKASFAELPNQTTWLEETVQRGSSLERDRSRVAQGAVPGSPSTEFSGIRRKLEERRKQIENEKKKMEMQWSKQRQQVGKEAFIQVVTKHHLGSSSQNDLPTASRNERPAYCREVSDGELMLAKRNEREFHSPAVRDFEGAEGGNVMQFDSNSSVRPENTKGLKSNTSVTGQSLAKSAAKSVGSDKRTKTSTDKVTVGKGTNGMNSSAGYHSDISEYGTSLDRLNSSLSELQGEIMRLSLQQDQIKSLVGSDLEPPLESKKSFPTHASAQNSKEQFYLFPRNTANTVSGTGQPMALNVCGSVTSSVNSSVSSNVSRSNSGGQHGSSLTGLASFPGSKSFANPMGFVNPGMPLRGELYSTDSNPMNAQHANQQGAYPHYYPMPQVPYLDGVGYSMPMANSARSVASCFPVSQHGSIGYPVQNFSSYGVPWHSVRPIEASGVSGGTVDARDTATTGLTETQHVPSSAANSLSDVDINKKVLEDPTPVKTSLIPNSPLLQFGLHHSDPTNYDLQNLPSASTSLSSPGSCISSAPSSLPTESKPSNIPSSYDDTMPASAPGEAFFMVLDSDLPRKPKPVLSTRLRKKEALSANVPEAYSLPATEEVAVAVEERKEPDPVPCEAVGFVVGVDESIPNQELQLEVEKKRQRMAEMHQRRQEELESKKQKIEMEQQAKREALRLKQEKNEEKKAKERARREEIFQSYLQRKAEDDVPEDDVKLPSHSAGKRSTASKVKLQRPKSQPPPSSGTSLNEESQGYSTPSSVGGRMTDPRTGSPGSDLSRSSERLNTLATNFEQLETRLAFGNLGQRTPSSADRIPRFVSSSSDGGGSEAGISGSQLPDNYAGPKLFVKPSQKSNRHIMVNAIKDCCLAGLVNQDLKNKVVEEINKSESKHFVILFRDAGMQYRGLYTYNPEREDVFKIHGVGPNRLLDKMMERFYKYNSGAKNFTEVTSTKHLSATIDAVTILGTLWQKKPSAGSNKRLI